LRAALDAHRDTLAATARAQSAALPDLLG
jgi:hypothetical protein